jgi:hypothetical protein
MLEHAILVRRICWHRLAAVPHLYDPATLEAEQVDDRYACLALAQHDVGVHSHQVAFAEHVLDRELFVRELRMVLDHRLFQCRKSRREKGIVVLALHFNILLIRFINTACHDKLQELHGCLFAILGVAVYRDDFSFT